MIFNELLNLSQPQISTWKVGTVPALAHRRPGVNVTRCVSNQVHVASGMPQALCSITARIFAEYL